MENFISVTDVSNVNQLVQEALKHKHSPFEQKNKGKNMTLGLIFFNPSLRTRLSTQKAAANLGLDVMVMNYDKEGWQLETAEGAVMNGNTAEHIKDAARVMGSYCDIIGIRSFPKLLSREEDYSEHIINNFIEYAGVPIVSLESATLHPLQSLADLMTITEHASPFKKNKVVLTWAPHVKPLPQAVANSFSEWMIKADVDFVITHPKGYELSDKFTNGATITTDREEALKDADFIYVKNWSSFSDYGKILPVNEDWLLKPKDLKLTNNARIMHCLPVRREVEISGALLDSENSLIIKQAENRIWAAQAVLSQMLDKITPQVAVPEFSKERTEVMYYEDLNK
jgi:N-succinyl-L-ornithine transcarbamylase